MKRDFTKIIEHSWLDKLNPFLQSERFDNLSNLIIEHQVISTPSIENIFRCFKECPYSGLKVVIVGMDPYPGVTSDKQRVADGIAFSSRSSVNKPPKSLEQIYRAIEEDFSICMDRRNNDLTYLANQGVLFLNSALTTQIGKTGSYVQEWKPFIEYVINMIYKTYNGIIYVYMGKVAQEFNKITTNDLNYVFNIEHPAAAVYHGGVWNHQSIFKNINNILDMMYNQKLKFNEV